MLRRVFKTTVTINFTFFPINVTDHDSISNATPTEQNADLTIIESETGWDRVKRMFEADDFGELSNELSSILHVGAMSIFVGGIYGGVLSSKTAYIDFIKNNQATAFNDHLHAKKKLQDAVTKSFGRGAFKWAWRLSLFTTTFTGISTTISVYRGKSGIIEYVAAGLVTGTLYKFNMGPRGWIVGGGLGSVLGLIAGGVTLSLLNLTGMTMEEVRYWQYHFQRQRKDHFNKGVQDYLTKEETEILSHDEKLKGSGKSLDSIK